LDDSSLSRLNVCVQTGFGVSHNSQLTHHNPVVSGIGVQKQNKTMLPKKLDFKKGALEYRRKRLVGNLVKGVVEAFVIVAVFVSVLTSVGVIVNKKYEGRSLPFTYVGDTYIGGKTKEQIKTLLDEKYSQMYITFDEGGLRRQLKFDQLNIEMDTETFSQSAIPKKPNVLSFLEWKRLEVPIKMSDRYVTGYIERRINTSQTKSEDAQLMIDGNKLVVRPEVTGFTSDAKFIIEQIRFALASGREPYIDVTSVTTKPNVLAADLADDLEKSNSLLQTPISIKLGYRYIRPTIKQKIDWLSVNQLPGAKNVDFDFSKGLVRAYILEQAKRYQPAIRTTASENGESTGGQLVIENVDEVAYSIVLALKTGNQTTQQLVIKDSGDRFTAQHQPATNTLAVANQ